MTIFERMHTLSPSIEEKDFEDIIKRFSKNQGVKESDLTKFFDMYWMPFVWAAVIGFTEDLDPIPLQGKYNEHFKYSTINNSSQKLFNSLIMFVVAKKGYEILDFPSEINKCIEEYANAGFEVLYTILRDKPEYFNNPNNYIKYIIDDLK